MDNIMLGHYWRENSFAEEGMEDLVDELTMDKQCALTVKVVGCILGCTSKAVSSRSKEVFLGPLFSICNWSIVPAVGFTIHEIT